MLRYGRRERWLGAPLRHRGLICRWYLDKLIVEIGIHIATGREWDDSASRTMVIGHGYPVSCGDVLVNPGDIVFGDIDGVVVIPKELAKEVFSLALRKSKRGRRAWFVESCSKKRSCAMVMLRIECCEGAHIEKSQVDRNLI